MTMTFVVMGLGTVFNALTNRRDPASGLDAADPQGARRSRSFPLAMIVLATELPGLQQGLLTDVAHRPAVARLHRPRRCCCRSSIESEQVDPPPAPRCAAPSPPLDVATRARARREP